MAVSALSAGCLSNKPGSTSTAYTVIENVPQEKIHDTLIDVFVAEHYSLEMDNADQLVFTRPATQRDVFLFGDLHGSEMTMRVDVRIKPHGPNSHLVSVDAEVLMDDRVDAKVGKIGSRQYQAILNRARKELSSKSAN